MADEAAAAVPKGPVSVKHVDMPEDMQKVHTCMYAVHDDALLV